MAAQLSALTASLSDDQQILRILPAALGTLVLEQAIARAEAEHAEEVLKKWCLRVSSLLNGPREGIGRSAALQLALETSRQSQAIFLTQRAWTAAALASLNQKAASPALLQAALASTAFSLQEAARLPEFSRDIFKPDTLKQVARDAGGIALNGSADLTSRIHALELLCLLLRLHAITLRPVVTPAANGAKGDAGPAIQDVALIILCDTTAGDALSDAAARLFAHLWLTAGKKDGSQRYQQSVEALCGSWHACIGAVTRTFEEASQPSWPAPLNLPPLASSTAHSAFSSTLEVLKRLNSIERMLLAMLQTVTERPVAIPVGTLVQLILRSFALSSSGKTRLVADPALRPAELSALTELHSAAARLLVQLLGSHLAPHVSALLAHLCHAIDATVSQSPLRSSLLAAAVYLVANAGMDPQDSHYLAKILRLLLASVAVLVNADKPKQAKPGANGTDTKRKAKKARYEVDQAFAYVPPVSAGDLTVAEHALQSLRTVLDAPAAAFLPGSETNLSLRLLVAIVGSPAFVAAQPPVGTQEEDSLQVAFAARPSLRIAVLHALAAALPSASREAAGLLEHILSALNACASSSDDEARVVAARTLALVELTLHPRVPPLLSSDAWERAAIDRLGGMVVAEASRVETEEEPILEPDNIAIEEEPESAAPALPAQEIPAAAPVPVAATLPRPIFTLPTPPAPAVPAASAEQVSRAPAPAVAPVAAPSAAAPQQKPAYTASYSRFVPVVEEEDDDEPMPQIDMRDSSDEEEQATV